MSSCQDRRPELATRLSAMRSHVKVLFISGYTDNGLAHHGPEPGIMFLQKPFTTAALLHKVREVWIHRAAARSVLKAPARADDGFEVLPPPVWPVVSAPTMRPTDFAHQPSTHLKFTPFLLKE